MHCSSYASLKIGQAICMFDGGKSSYPRDRRLISFFFKFSGFCLCLCLTDIRVCLPELSRPTIPNSQGVRQIPNFKA